MKKRFKNSVSIVLIIDVEEQMIIAHDDDDFASCDEDERAEENHEKSGDSIKDFYLDVSSVKNKEDRSKIL